MFTEKIVVSRVCGVAHPFLCFSSPTPVRREGSCFDCQQQRFCTTTPLKPSLQNDTTRVRFMRVVDTRFGYLLLRPTMVRPAGAPLRYGQ